ncbi:hypothetical protein PENSTE_c020G05990 [Penicillium steckii]|uniref:Uncharacterized protein n=1 Tax=Penicillium steckii TaxID=303698 RepID=A0A1V6SVG5_9EURO|nr:hypothetical protein PENSTE_c020G05990 [Penicillium steckii]
MKLSLSLAVATLVSASVAAESPFPSSLPALPKACQEIPQAIGLKPAKLLKQFHDEVCEKNKCNATINEHNDYLVQDVFPKLISDLDKNLDISAKDKQVFSKVREQAKDAVKQKCTAKGKQPLCNDPQGLFEWGSCAIQASAPVYQKHMQQLASVSKLSESQCEKLKDLDTDETFWSKTIPGYIEKFAEQCESKN